MGCVADSMIDSCKVIRDGDRQVMFYNLLDGILRTRKSRLRCVCAGSSFTILLSLYFWFLAEYESTRGGHSSLVALSVYTVMVIGMARSLLKHSWHADVWEDREISLWWEKNIPFSRVRNLLFIAVCSLGFAMEY
eukprot:gene18149-5744_t